ncbi:hypothetical protein TCAL_01907 [Tigriopus californicus]|uniref:SAM domain-containing protein n=1 Tax=Tigriopus californicus TaxID=6832 RepID=A0A553P840_TIGCA|nr:MBT domain-containing protein 1-like [Tigriopus californicus]TRY73854.1 hypothetical protein TCAL_01907 [Tigriopus californicus]
METDTPQNPGTTLTSGPASTVTDPLPSGAATNGAAASADSASELNDPAPAPANAPSNAPSNAPANAPASDATEGWAPVAARDSSASDSSLIPARNLVFSYPIEDYTHPSLSTSHDLKHSYSWESLMSAPDFVAAPVTAFKHAPMSECWDQITVGMKVEVENKDAEHFGLFDVSYWVASVLRLSGYNALLRYEGFGQDGTKDFWLSVCSDKIHPVGWCATKGKPLIPPRAIQTKRSDWKDYLVKRLTGARTLPTNFYSKVWQSVGSIFKPGMKLEVVDKMRICQVRVATIFEIIGRRLYLQYDNVDHNDKGFWCHEESPLIHPVGWAHRVGHQIEAPQAYYDRCALETYTDTDCTADMFPEYKQPPGQFQVGMKIEAVDPLNLATVCVATIMKVLRFGYIMVRIDGYETDETGSDWFCYHGSSPLIFPPGYCEKKNIKLKPPTGWEDNFTWYDYLKETKAQAAAVSLFNPHRDDVRHGFKVGMKVEASDQMDPRLICVSTIGRVVGRLLKVHFDGWEDDYDQWMDCENVDIYPVGWAELVGHKLEGPRKMPPQKKEKRKPVGRKGKKRASAGGGNSSNAGGSTTVSPNPNNQGPLATPNGRKSGRKTASPVNVKEVEEVPEVAPLAPKTPSPSPPPPPPPASSSSALVAVPASSSPPPPVLEAQSVEPASPTPPPPTLTPALAIKVIPRLVDSAGQVSNQRIRDSNLDPANWNVDEVAQFLEINDCATLVDAFIDQGVDGSRFLSLAKEEVMKLANNKIGPCLKVENLLTLLKARMNPAQARFLATIRKSTP